MYCYVKIKVQFKFNNFTTVILYFKKNWGNLYYRNKYKYSLLMIPIDKLCISKERKICIALNFQYIFDFKINHESSLNFFLTCKMVLFVTLFNPKQDINIK